MKSSHLAERLQCQVIVGTDWAVIFKNKGVHLQLLGWEKTCSFKKKNTCPNFHSMTLTGHKFVGCRLAVFSESCWGPSRQWRLQFWYYVHVYMYIVQHTFFSHLARVRFLQMLHCTCTCEELLLNNLAGLRCMCFWWRKELATLSLLLRL